MASTKVFRGRVDKTVGTPNQRLIDGKSGKLISQIRPLLGFYGRFIRH